MASPFATLRKYQFAFFVFFGVVCMIVFVIGDPLDSWLRSRSGGSRSTKDEVVVTWSGGQLTENELGFTQSVRNVIREFVRNLLTETQKKNGQPRVQVVSLSPSEEDIAYTQILAQRAQAMGMVVSDESALIYLEQLTANLIPRAGIGKLFQESVAGRINEQQLLEEIKTELLAQSFISLTYPDLTRGQLPAQAWDYYRRLNRRLQAEVVPLNVAQFVGKVAKEPSATEIQALYDQAKNRYPDPGSPEPGFRRHRKAAFEFVQADRKKIEAEETAKVKPTITDAEIDDYYSKNKEQFRIPDAPLAATTPAAPPATPEKPADPAKPAEAPLPEAKPAEKPAEPAPAEKPADKPAEPAKPESAKPESTKPAETKPGEGAECGQEPAATEKPAEPAPEKKDSPAPTPDAPKPDAPKPEAPAASETPKPAATPPADAPKPEAAPAAPAPDAAKPATPPTDAPQPAAAPAAPANPAPPAPAEPKYKPLAEVKEEIRTKVAEQKAMQAAQQRIDKAFEEVKRAIEKYAREKRSAELAGKPTPAPVDLAKLAESHGMTAGSTKLVGPKEIQETPLGKTRGFDFSSMSFEPIPFHVLAYRDGISLFTADQIRGSAADGNPDAEFLYWKNREEEPFVPELNDVRQEVIDAWKLREAVVLATAEAKSLAEKAKKEGKPLKEVFADNKDLKVTDTSPFTWMTRGFLPANMGGTPTLGTIEQVEFAGNDFMQAVSALNVGEVGVAVNHPKTTVYVVRMVSAVPADEVLQDQFLQSGNSFDVQQVAAMDRMQIRQTWLDGLKQNMKVTWKRDPRN